MVVSLKANKKRVFAFLVLVVAVVGACIFLHGEQTEPQQQSVSGATNEERISFLQSFGWQVSAEATETREVMIPAEFNEVYTTYNVMQQAQGFDLKPYAGQVCTQYRYAVNNYPDETEVYATLLVYGEEIIGGDVASSKAAGFMHGFAKDSARYGETAQQKSESSMAESSASSEVSSEIEDVSSLAEEVESTAGDVTQEDAYPTD